MKEGEIESNISLDDGYYKVKFYVPEITKKAQAGQFVHIKIAQLADRILRRPFSICNVSETGLLTVLYKVVGQGTEQLAKLKAGDVCNLMGPLGKSYSIPSKDEISVMIAGGYGAASTFMLAKKSLKSGYLLLGARSKKDLILVDEYEKEGVTVLVSTEDGTVGHKGLVTELINDLIEKNSDKKLKFYACGPMGMLMAVGKQLLKLGIDSELSLDHLMCCGVGACFACVIKVKANNEDGWRYARTCNEGPIFNASEVYYG